MSIADKIKNFFFPNRCPFCNKVIEEKEIVCKDCISKFPINYFDGLLLVDLGVFHHFTMKMIFGKVY